MALCKHKCWEVIDAEMNKGPVCDLTGKFCVTKCDKYIQDPSMDQLIAEKLIEISLDAIKDQITLNASFTRIWSQAG